MEAEEVVRALKKAKPKLELEYCVQISEEAFDVAVALALKPPNFNVISEDATQEVAVVILGRACELVLERFRNCAYESEFYDKAYELRRALVDVIELYRDNNPSSQPWLSRVRWERNRASVYMSDSLDVWENILMTFSGFCGFFNPEYPKARLLKSYASQINCPNCHPPLDQASSEELTTKIRQILNDIQGELILYFSTLLTVEPCHVAEVVSSLTDVPLTEIPFPVSYPKETAMLKTHEWVVNQELIAHEIFKFLACPRRMTARPRGLFLLLGRSGTGKTEIAKSVAKHWYCDATRLVEIDMSEYAAPELESASLFAWSKRKHLDFLKRVSEVVRKRPYSVILLDKIDKAAFSVSYFLFEVLSNDAPTNTEGKAPDFSKSIIFMTSSVGTSQLQLACSCFNQSRDLWIQFRCDPVKFDKMHDCPLKGSGSERVLVEARKFFGADLLDSLDKVFVVDDFHDSKAVCRLLLREVVREVTGGRSVVQISNAALDALIQKAWKEPSEAGKAIKESLLEDVIPQLPAVEGYNSAVVYVDTLVGTHELSFRFETREQSIDDWYLKLKDGTFGGLMAELRTKVQSVYSFFELCKKCLPLLDHSRQDFDQLGKNLLAICDLMPTPPPECASELRESKLANHNLITFCNPLPKCAFAKGDNPFMLEEKEMIKNGRRRLQEIATGPAKATRIIVDAVVKIIDTPLQSPNFPARCYLFLCLDDDAKTGLNSCLTQSLPFFTHVALKNDYKGEELKELLIGKVKERRYAVFLLDGVEYADAVQYRSLLEIFDKGTLDDGEGSIVNFRRTIVILTSEVVNKHIIADIFDYEQYVLHNMAKNQNLKRFRSELLHRVDEIIVFDPILPEHGGILRLPKRDRRYREYPNNMLLSKFLSDVF